MAKSSTVIAWHPKWYSTWESLTRRCKTHGYELDSNWVKFQPFQQWAIETYPKRSKAKLRLKIVDKSEPVGPVNVKWEGKTKTSYIGVKGLAKLEAEIRRLKKLLRDNGINYNA